LIETSLLTNLKKEAEDKEVSLGHFVRSKLRKKPQLDRIEEKLDKLVKRIN
jgi:predicted membrane chloride channel (bestrophin family)